MDEDIESERPKAPKCYEITKSDLPLSCPMPTIPLWNSHPKVYLPIEKAGKVSCPYCGTGYVLKGFEPQAL